MQTFQTASGITILLAVAGGLVGATGAAAQSGVAFAGDLESIDQAVIDSAALPLPSFGQASGSRLVGPQTQGVMPLPAGGVRTVAAQLPSRAPAPVAPAREPASTKRTTLFGSLKKRSAWLFGGDSEPTEPAADPFAAAAKPVAARIPTSPATPSTQAAPQGVQVAAYRARTASAPSQPMSQSPASRRAGSATSRSSGITARESKTPQRGLFSGWFGGTGDQSSAKPTSPRVATRPTASAEAGRKPTASPVRAPSAAARYARPSLTLAKPLARTVEANAVLMPVEPESAAAVMVSDATPLGSAAGSQPAVRRGSPAQQGLASKAVALRGPIAAPLDRSADAGRLTPEPPTTVVATLPPIQPTTPAAAPIAVVAPAVVQAPSVKPATATGPQRSDFAEPLTVVGERGAMLSAPGSLLDATDIESPLAIEAAERLSMTEPSDEPTIATDSLVVIDAGEPAPLTVYPPAAEEAAPPSDRSRDLLREAHHLAGGAATADDYAAIIKRCRYVLAIDRSQEAIAYANQLAAWSLSKRGELHDEAGRDGEAEADFLDAIAADPECWRAEHRLGVQAARRGEFSEARRRFDRSLQIHPEHAKALGNRAAIELAEGDLPAALADYRQALEIDPDLASAHLGCGRVCHMTERYAEGLRHLDAAEVLAPGDAAVATARGDLLSDLGRYAQARDAYGRAIVLDPQASTAYRNLAWLLATCPQPEHRDGVAALANAERAEQLLGGADDLTLDTRAAALAAAGRFDEAVAAQRGAIDLAPPIDAAAYRERLSLYERGEAFSSRPSGVRQASYNADVAR